MKAAVIEALNQPMRAADDWHPHLHESGTTAAAPYRIDRQRPEHQRRVHRGTLRGGTTARPKNRVDPANAITFGPFRLDLPGGRLLRGGETIRLRPKTWSVLLYLAERPGVLVSRNELLDAVWPDVAVTPGTLTKSIGEIRVALGDDCRTPRWIETVHRRGFRFVATTSADRSEDPVPTARRVGPDAMFVAATELERLEELFAMAGAGQLQIALITRAHSIGKTALVDTLFSTLAENARESVAWRHAEVALLRGAPDALLVVIDDQRVGAPRPASGMLLTRKEHRA